MVTTKIVQRIMITEGEGLRKVPTSLVVLERNTFCHGAWWAFVFDKCPTAEKPGLSAFYRG